jgi:hypothetical protein
VNSAIQEQKVKIIIFEDVQHILDAGMDAFGAADVFKLFLKSRVAVVCIGLPYALGLGKVNKQLDRLVQQEIMVPPMRCSIGDFPDLDDKGSIKGGEKIEKTPFRNFMEAIDHRAGAQSVLPFDEPSNLSHPQMALRIHQATGGFVGEIMKLVQRASVLAIVDGRSKVITQDFEQAYENSERCSDEANWFKQKWPKFVERFGSLPADPDKGKAGEADKNVEKYLKQAEKRVRNAMAGRK